jgi:protein SCO1/2
MKRKIYTGLFLAAALIAGCHSGKKDQQQGAAASNVTVYHLRGKLVSIDTANGIVDVDHEAIPGFMDAMTMPYQLKDPSVTAKLHPGDEITADVLVSKNSDDTVLLDHVVVVAQAKPHPKPTGYDGVPAGGDEDGY